MYGSLNKLNLLEDSFVKNGIEVVHVRDLYHVSSMYHFKHSSYLYTEVYLAVDATTYFLDDGNVNSKIIQSLNLTIDTIEILKVSEDNIGILLLDEDKCVRQASADWLSSAV